MPDQEDLNQDAPENGEERNFAALREKAEKAERENATLMAQLAESQRRDAFRDAGLDPTNKLHQTVIRGYDGELEAEKVRQYVAELGLTKTEPPAPQLPQEERDALTRINQNQAGGEAPTSPPTQDDELISHMNNLRATGRPGIDYAAEIGNFLASRNPELVSHDGPQSDPVPWSQV